MSKEIKPHYLTFEQAKWLKEKGFNELCCKGFYIDEDEIDFSTWLAVFQKNTMLAKNYCTRPEQWQVVEWLRINHGIWINVSPVFEFNDGKEDYLQLQGWQYYISIIKENKLINSQANRNKTKSPQEEYSAAFNYILKNNLI